MSVLKEGAPDLLEYLPGYPRMGAPHNISAIIRRLEKQVAELIVQSESAPIKPDPVAELCTYIKENIRLCPHGYIHITCGDCQRRD